MVAEEVEPAVGGVCVDVVGEAVQVGGGGECFGCGGIDHGGGPGVEGYTVGAHGGWDGDFIRVAVRVGLFEGNRFGVGEHHTEVGVDWGFPGNVRNGDFGGVVAGRHIIDQAVG